MTRNRNKIKILICIRVDWEKLNKIRHYGTTVKINGDV